MLNPIRYNHDKLLLPVGRALYSIVPLPKYLRQCLTRSFASATVQKLPKTPSKTLPEQKLAPKNIVNLDRSSSLYTTRASNVSSNSHDQIQPHIQNSQDGVSDAVRKGSRPFSIRKHYGRDSGGMNLALGVKYLDRTGMPLDSAEVIPDIARFRSKREDQAATEEFLGIGRVTKHEIVSRALKYRVTQARAIHRKKKGEQDLFKWSQSLKSNDHLDESGDGLHGNEVSEAQSTGIPEKHFDILDAIGSRLQAANANKEASSTLEAREDSVESKSIDDDSFDIDWDNLPLSPLIHQRLIKARTKFRGTKPSYKDATDYDKQRGWEIANDCLATMLASPIRTCRLTYARLPQDFLLTMQTIQHPETRQVWELPKGLDPQDVTEGSPSSGPALGNTSDIQSTIRSKAQPTNSPESAQGSSSILEIQNIPEEPGNDFVSNNINSYMLFTRAAVQMISNLSPARYIRTVPARWRAKLGNKLASNIHWRNDMPDFVHSLIQRQINDQLKNVSSSSGEGLIQVCVTSDESGNQKIESLSSFKACVILYFGKHDQSNTIETSFYSMVNAIASSQTFKGEIFDDLFRKSRNLEGYARLVRIQTMSGENILVFDMTRLLAPNFAQSLFHAGFNQPAYCIADEPGSRFLRNRLWWLAHYLD